MISLLFSFSHFAVETCQICSSTGNDVFPVLQGTSFSGLYSSLYCWSRYRAEPICAKRVQRYEKRQSDEMEVAKENDNKQMGHNRMLQQPLLLNLFCHWKRLNGCHILSYTQCNNEPLFKTYQLVSYSASQAH